MANKVSYKFDPWALAGVDPPAGRKTEVEHEVMDFVVEKVKEYCAKGASPVSGGEWQRKLSEPYKKRKLAEGGQGFADMELKGDMLSALTCIRVGGQLELRIAGKQAAKADGHNNHSGESSLPTRKFIPEDGEKFKADIVNGIKRIVRSAE